MGRKFPHGSVLVRVGENPDQAPALIAKAAEIAQVPVYASRTLRAPGDGVDMGGRHFRRLSRPRGLSPTDAQKVIAYATKQLGSDYDVRQMVDLTRFVFPWSILPRRWRSTLFQRRAGQLTRTVCSTLIAEAFSHVRYPILPFVHRDASDPVGLTAAAYAYGISGFSESLTE